MSSAQILIVEDERLIARCMKKELEAMGYGVPLIAATGEEALAKFDAIRPDLVLMDIVLKGGLDGIETTRQLRTRSHVPVVYVSGQRDSGLLERAHETEPLGFLLKPYEENELRATIAIALNRHRLEQRVHDTEQWLYGTLSALPDAVIATDILQRIAFMNPVAERLVGYTAAEAQESDLERVLHVHYGNSTSAVAVTERKTMETGESAALPPGSQLRIRDGHKLPVEGTCTPIVNGQGHYTGYVWVIRDISNRINREAAQRRRTEAELTAENSFVPREDLSSRGASRPHFAAQDRDSLFHPLSDRASATAHEFNNLLTMILGNASLVLCTLPESDTNFHGLVSIHSAALRAMTLLQRVQGGSRISNFGLVPVSLQATLRQLAGRLPQLISSAIALEFRFDPDLWPVRSSPELLEELVITLCLGACETMPRGGRVILETENVSLSEDDVLFQHCAHAGDFVRLRFSEDGDGKSGPPNVRLLDREIGAGDSLCGLDGVRELIRRHDGWIESFNEPGATRLEVHLPRAQAGTAQPRPTAAPSTGEIRRQTVLLVDDEQMLRDLGRRILHFGGFDVLVAEDGEAAVKTFAREKDRIGVVILDLSMPRLSGDETFHELLRLDPDVHVLFCSGYPEDNVKSLRHPQVCGFINKPYRNEELLEAVRFCIEERNRAR